MSKSSNSKQENKSTETTLRSDAESEVTSKPKSAANANTNRPASTPGKETAAASRSKKTKANATKTGSLMPSENKLENLAAAIAASGNADNLLQILGHVDAAGGPAEVIESIEAYWALKTAVEQNPESKTEQSPAPETEEPPKDTAETKAKAEKK